MELAFATRELRALCEDSAKAVEAYGEAVAESLASRLADLRAAGSIGDLVAGHPMEFSSPRPGVAVRLAAGHVLVCEANEPRTRSADEGRAVDVSRLRRLKVVTIGPEEEIGGW